MCLGICECKQYRVKGNVYYIRTISIIQMDWYSTLRCLLNKQTYTIISLGIVGLIVVLAVFNYPNIIK